MYIWIRNLNYIYLIAVILWTPFNLTFLKIDGKGRLMFLFTIIALILNVIHDKSFLKYHIKSTPIYFWGIWILYSSANLLLKGYHGELSFIYFVMHNLFIPFFTMVLARKEVIRNRKKFLELISIVFIIFAMFSVTTGLAAGGSDLNLERSMGALGNIGPLTSLFIVFLFGLRYVNKWVKISTLIPVIIFTIGIITLSGTRKAFGALVIIIFTIVITKFKFQLKNLILLLVLSIGINLGYNYVMENTIIGERFEKGVVDGEELNSTDYEALNYLGDRVYFYIKGWNLFLEYPFTGVGLKNFKHNTDSGLVLHTEYFVQLVEGGIIGTFIFLLFYIGIGKLILRSWKRFKKRRAEIWLFLGAFCAILFINITAWTYSFPHYFLIFGIILGYLDSIKFENHKIINNYKKYEH